MNLKEAILSTKSVRRAQHPTRRIGAVDFKYVRRTKQLYVQAQAFPLDRKSRRSPYRINLVFHGITASDEPDKLHSIPYNNGRGLFYIEHPTVNNRVGTRCQCDDFYFMWGYYNKKDKGLVGPYKPYTRKTTTRPSINPDNAVGLCKHQLQLVKLLMDENIVTKDNTCYRYLTLPPR